MKRIVIFIGIMVAVTANLQAAVYYSQGTRYLTSGSNMNTERDGSGTDGFSTTYSSPANDIVLQAPVDYFYYNNTLDPYGEFNANSYTLENGVILQGRTSTSVSYATFNGGDITIADGAIVTFKNNQSVGVGVSSGGITGTANMQLGANTLNLDQGASTSTGVWDLGLNVVGSGLIDLRYSAVGITWNLSNLSSDFIGRIDGDTFNGILQLAAGDGAINAEVRIGRALGDKEGKLDLNGSFSVDQLSIDGEDIAVGSYTYAQLVAFGDTFGGVVDFSNNLVDNGGTVFVGQVIPEPATLGMIGLVAAGMFFIRRRLIM